MSRLPALFVGHGSPMNATWDNGFTRALSEWGRALSERKPRAILCVSAHWWGPALEVTSSASSRLIYDFNGFPENLYQLQYPCVGHPALADRVRALAPEVGADSRRGIDHGAWTILLHLFPQAQIPVVQLSLSMQLTEQEHWDLGRKLRPLRDEGILVIGSGNIVHSFIGFRGPEDAPPHALGVEFETKIVRAIDEKDATTLIRYSELGEAARFSSPTPDHYLPLLYPLAMREPNEGVSYPFTGYQYSSMSMRCLQVGS